MMVAFDVARLRNSRVLHWFCRDTAAHAETGNAFVVLAQAETSDYQQTSPGL